MDDCLDFQAVGDSQEASVSGDGERLRWCECPLSAQEVDAAVLEVFELMMGALCTPGEPESVAGECVVAEIRMNGSREGRCVVELPAEAGDWLTDSLMGSEADWDDDMIRDTVGELCNMITGGVKRRLGRWLGVCSISLPEVSRRDAGELAAVRDGEMRRMYRVGETTLTVKVSFYGTL